MAKVITMETTRYKRVILVGEVTETILDALREQMRREKILDAFQRAQEVSAGTPNTAPETQGRCPRRTTNDGPTGESGVGGKQLNR